jgi:alpha-glucosidase
MRAVFDEFPGSTSVGEVFGAVAEIGNFYGAPDSGGLHLAFNFRLILRDGSFTPWDTREISVVLSESEQSLPPHAQPCFALGNHDQPRLASRHNAGGCGPLRARAAALLLLALRGTPFLYYGDELGMLDVDVPEDQMQDPARFHHLGRDPQRTPMQWDASPGRGFTSGKPWLPFGPAEINVATQLDDPDSLLALYRQAIHIRKREPSLCTGSMTVLPGTSNIVCFERHAVGARPILCAINTAAEPKTLTLPNGYTTILLATHRHSAATIRGNTLTLERLAAAWLIS